MHGGSSIFACKHMAVDSWHDTFSTSTIQIAAGYHDTLRKFGEGWLSQEERSLGGTTATRVESSVTTYTFGASAHHSPHTHTHTEKPYQRWFGERPSDHP